MSSGSAPLGTLVVGAGGVGGHLAVTLARGGELVGVVARGAHGAAIAEGGLRLVEPGGAEAAAVPAAVASRLEEAPAARRVALAVKHADLAAVIDALPGYIDGCPSPPAIVALQNGVAHLDGPLTDAARGRLAVAGVYIFSHVAAPGVVEVTGGPRIYRLGPALPDDEGSVAATRECGEVWAAAGLAVDVRDDGRRVLWEKLSLLAALSGFTSLTGRSIGELRAGDELMTSLATMMDELIAVATAEGVSVAEGFRDTWISGLRRTDPDGRSSLHLDLSTGRASELELLLGDPLRRAERHGVPTPTLRAVYAATRARWLG